MGWMKWAGAALNPSMALGALTSFGGDIAGYFGAEADRRSVEASNASNRASSEAQARANIEMQYEFAKNGIRWRAEDAAAAGLHPMAALGASGAQASPVYSAFNDQPVSKGDSWRALSSMGQNIQRAVMATQTQAERTQEALRSVNMQKQNDLLDVQIGLAKQDLARFGQTPPMPVTGQWMLDRQGGKTWVPSDDYSRAASSMPFSALEWWFKNKFIPKGELYKPIPKARSGRRGMMFLD